MVNLKSRQILLQAIQAFKKAQQPIYQQAPPQPDMNMPQPKPMGGVTFQQPQQRPQLQQQPQQQFSSAFGLDPHNFAPSTAQPRPRGKSLLQRGGGLLAELLRGISLGKGGYQQYAMEKAKADIRKQQAGDEMNKWIQQLGAGEAKERRMVDYRESFKTPEQEDVRKKILRKVASGEPLSGGEQKVYDEIMTTPNKKDALLKLLGGQFSGGAGVPQSIPFTTEELNKTEAQLIKDGFRGLALRRELDKIRSQGKPVNPQ